MEVGPSWNEVGPWRCVLVVWALAFLSQGGGVRPPFSGPSVFLMVVVASSFLLWGFALSFWSGVGPSFLEVAPLVLRGVGFGPSFSGLGLACPSSGGDWSCLFGVGLALPSWCGVRDSLLEWGWPFLDLALGVMARNGLSRVVE